MLKKDVEDRQFSMSQIPPSVQNWLRHAVKIAKPQKVILFGSRARGTGRKNSDFDICFQNKSCSEPEWAELLNELESEPYTLFRLDISEFETLPLGHLTQIQNEGVLLYDGDFKF